MRKDKFSYLTLIGPFKDKSNFNLGIFLLLINFINKLAMCQLRNYRKKNDYLNAFISGFLSGLFSYLALT